MKLRYSCTGSPASLTALALLLSLPSASVFAQAHQEWVQRYSLNPAKTNQAVALTVVKDGGVVVAGSSRSPLAEFDDLDYVAIRYDESGHEVWKLRYNSLDRIHDTMAAMAKDSFGNLFVTGSSDTIKISPQGTLLWNAPTMGRALAVDTNSVYVVGFSDTDQSVCRLDTLDGQNLWTRFVDGAANSADVSQSVASDSEGNVFVAGMETMICGHRLPCQVSPAVIKLDKNGTVLWRRTSGVGLGTLVAAVSSLLDSADSFLVLYNEEVGLRYGCSRFTQTGTQDLDYALSGAVGDVVKTQGNAFAVGPKENIHITGTDHRAGGGFPTNVAATTVVLKRDGSPLWKAMYPPTLEGQTRGRAIAVDSNGNTFVAGTSTNSTTGTDLFVIKYDVNGLLLWSQTYDGPAHGDDFPTGMTLDGSGNIYVCGYSATTEGGTEFVTIKYSEFPKIEKQPSGAMRLQFQTTPHAAYTLQATTNFFDWNNLLTNTADATGLVQFDDTEAPTIPFRFYRGQTTP